MSKSRPTSPNDFASSPSLKQTKQTTMVEPTIEYDPPVIFNSLSDLQGELLNLYTGESVQLFSEMIPMCGHCEQIPVGATDCVACHRDIVCVTCRTHKNLNTCLRCWSQGAKVATIPPEGENLTILKLLSKATFRCPYNCGDLRIPYCELEDHMLMCPERFVECALGCGIALKIPQIEKHQEKNCAEAQI